MNAAESAPSPKSFRKRFGTVKATVNALAMSPVPDLFPKLRFGFLERRAHRNG